MNRSRRDRFHESLNAHGLKGGLVHTSLPVVLADSANKFITYPAVGVLTIMEQGTDLSIIVAVFRHLEDDGRLGVPVEVRRPRFSFAPDMAQ